MIDECKVAEGMDAWIGCLALIIGSGILALGYLSLVVILPLIDKKKDTRISIVALRASSWLVIGGLTIIILAFLHLMSILPPNW